MYAMQRPSAFHSRSLHRDYAVATRRRPVSPWPARARTAALVVGAVIAMSLGLARAAQGQAPAAYETITVQPGDTLWAIAADRYPGRDVRAEVYRIEQVNHLQSSSVYSGQVLSVPTR